MFTCIPYQNEDYKNQIKQEEISDEEMHHSNKGPFFKWYHRIYQVLMFFIFLGPIRIILLTISFIICSVVTITVMTLLKALKFDLNKYRHLVIWQARFWIRIFLFCLGIGWIHIEGEFDNDARFMICNHIGLLDPIIMIYIRYVSFVIKKEFSKIPIVHNLIDVCDPIYVDRSKPCGLTKEIINQADNKNKDQIMIFPEGTICNGNYMLKFHRSAFLTSYKVQPIIMQFWTPFLPKEWNTFAFLDQNAIELVWDHLSMPFSCCRIKILPTISKDSENDDPDSIATRTQLMMANQLKIKAVNRSSHEFFNINK